MENPLDRFDHIMVEADTKLKAYAGPESSTEGIISFVDRVREERQDKLVAERIHFNHDQHCGGR